MPKVSVIILTYNSAQFIREALSSIVLQDYTDMEVIIGDDCSTDTTRSEIEKIEKETSVPFVKVFQSVNVGIARNFNDCLRLVKGEYLFIIGGDDVFLPGKIRTQVEFMDQNKNITISYHDVDVFDSASNRTLYLYNSGRHGFYKGKANLLVELGAFNCGCSTAIRFSSLILCDESIKFSFDTLWYIEILEKLNGEIGYFKGVFARYRRHETNISSVSPLSVQKSEMMQIFDVVEEKYGRLKNAVRIGRSERLFVLGVKSFLARDMKGFFELMLSAFKTNIFCFYFVAKRFVRRLALSL